MNIASWNIRGLNWPNKQEEVKLFLHHHNIGWLGLLETKVKPTKMNAIASNIFPGWNWINNFHEHPGGPIWIAWHPGQYAVSLLHR